MTESFVGASTQLGAADGGGGTKQGNSPDKTKCTRDETTISVVIGGNYRGN